MPDDHLLSSLRNPDGELTWKELAELAAQAAERIAASDARVTQLEGDLSDLRVVLGARADALRAIGWDGTSDPLTWAREHARESTARDDALKQLDDESIEASERDD